MFSTRLQTRLYLLVLIAVIPALGVIVTNAWRERLAGTTDARQDVRRLAESIAGGYGLLFEGDRQLLTVMKHLPEIRGLDNRTCSRLLSTLREQFPTHANLGVADSRGYVRCSAQPFKAPLYVGDRTYYRRARSSTGLVVDEYQVGRIVKKPVLIVALHEPGVGVLFAALDLVSLSGPFLGNRPASEEFMMLDRTGHVLAYRFRDENRDPPEDNPTLPVLRRAIEAQPTGGLIEVSRPTGEPYLYAFVPILHEGQSTGTYTIVGSPALLAHAAADRKFVDNFAVFIVVSALMFLAARQIGSRLVVHKIRSLIDTAIRIGQGEFGTRTRLPHAHDEIGHLAQCIDDMAEQLEQRATSEARHKESIARLARIHTVLSGINGVIVRTHDIPHLFAEACRIAVQEGQFALAWIGWVDAESGKIEPVAHAGDDTGYLETLKLTVSTTEPEGLGPTAQAIRSGSPYICNDIQADPYMDPWRNASLQHGYRSVAVFPLAVGGVVSGNINFYTREPNYFDDEERRLLLEMSSDISYALDNLERDKLRTAAEERIRYLAFHDADTDLPNRARFAELAQPAIETATHGGPALAMMVVGIVRLEEVSYTFGHRYEPGILKESANRLRALLPEDAILARGEGASYVVAMPGAELDRVTRLGNRITESLAEPFSVNGLEIELGAGVGLALCPAHAENLANLERQAYVAMNKARRFGGVTEVFTPSLDVYGQERLKLVGEIRHAIDHGELFVCFQPKIDLARQEVVGVEALVRWRHPSKGIVPPDHFIPIAEESGLILPMTRHVIELSFRQVHAWCRSGLRMPVAINLSAQILLDRSLVDLIAAELAVWQIDPELIEFEITESALMEDPGHARSVLARLRDRGHAIYVDDFGTGYSSLGYLKKLPIDALKIDKSFVLDMDRDADAATIVHSTIELAHNLGLKVVAEGIEREDILDRLWRMGCDAVQGYFISRPIDAEAFGEWLAEARWKRPDPGVA